jgi:flagellar assembly factor FliW
MPQILTRDYGYAGCSEEDILEFPAGLPGFPACRRFVPLRPRAGEPFIVLQSLDEVSVAFLTLPVEMLLPGYELRILPSDLVTLGGGPASRRTLVIVSLSPGGETTVNLLGPIVIDTLTRRGVQAIRDDSRYGAAERIDAILLDRSGQEAAVCS